MNTTQKHVENLKAEIERLNFELSKWRDQARKDGLTGCLRREAFMELLESRKKFGLLEQNVTIAILDVDHFKKINDTYGHLVGDQVLMKLGSLLVDGFSNGSIVSRMGGEEFVVLIPRPIEEAKLELEKMREKIANCGIRLSILKQLKFTASIGLAEWNTDEPFVKACSTADNALYRAKQQGRNRSVAA